MRDDRFEWDDRKAAANLRKHRVAFEHARLAFDDPRGIARPDLDETEEERMLLTGLAYNRLLTIAFVERGMHIRIISARKTSKNEQNDYIAQGA